jgi:hypothetical protein
MFVWLVGLGIQVLAVVPPAADVSCKEAAAPLQAQGADLAIGTLPAGAQVLLDGRVTGLLTPVFGARILHTSPGAHVVGLVSEGIHHVYRVTLTPGLNKLVITAMRQPAKEGTATYLGAASCLPPPERPRTPQAPEVQAQPSRPEYAGVRREVALLSQRLNLSTEEKVELQSTVDRALDDAAGHQRGAMLTGPPAGGATQGGNVRLTLAEKQARAQTLLDMGYHAVIAGEFGLALRCGELASGLDPENMDVHKLLGVASMRVAQYCVAKDHFQTWLGFNPDSFQAERVGAILQAPEMAACP